MMVITVWRYRSYSSHNNRFLERLSFYKNTTQSKMIWLHTASVGEVNAALPLINKLIEKYSASSIVVTTTTPTGEKILTDSLNSSVQHYFLPFDTSFLMRRFVTRIKPKLLVLFETEVWPSMLVESKRNGINSILVNARLSEKSVKKYKKVKSLSEYIFGQLALAIAQTKKDADNLSSVGVNDIEVLGNLKFSVDISRSMVNKAKKIVLNAFKELKKIEPNLLLVIVPRHVERCGHIYSLCEQYFPTTIYNEATFKNGTFASDNDIVLVDVTGKLLMLFGVSDIAIMGGTFIERGGHNFLEPAMWAIPIVSGKSDYNFTDIAKCLVDVQALTKVNNGDDLVNILKQLLLSKALRDQKGTAAQDYVKNQGDIIHRTMVHIGEHLQ